MFTPILIPGKNTRKLKNNVNPTSKKFNPLRFFFFFKSNKNMTKMGEKQSIMSLST